jgi:hypothetical protein
MKPAHPVTSALMFLSDVPIGELVMCKGIIAFDPADCRYDARLVYVQHLDATTQDAGNLLCPPHHREVFFNARPPSAPEVGP